MKRNYKAFPEIPRVAMAAGRRGFLDLIMNIYAGRVLLDVRAAVDALPAFFFEAVSNRELVSSGRQ